MHMIQSIRTFQSKPAVALIKYNFTVIFFIGGGLFEGSA